MFTYRLLCPTLHAAAAVAIKSTGCVCCWRRAKKHVALCIYAHLHTFIHSRTHTRKNFKAFANNFCCMLSDARFKTALRLIKNTFTICLQQQIKGFSNSGVSTQATSTCPHSGPRHVAGSLHLRFTTRPGPKAMKKGRTET